MFPWLFAFLALGAAEPTGNGDGPFGGLDHSRGRPRIEAFWWGLPSASQHGTARGIVALRVPLDRRVRITGGHFVMGSTAVEMQEGIRLCMREPLGSNELCRNEKTRDPWAIPAAIRSEGVPHDVTLSDYMLDLTEVTVEHYNRCVATGACAAASFTIGDPRYDGPDLPVTHVRWDDANDYCTWAGGRLPTEAEWEYAARGHDNRPFPWGNVYNPRLANHGSLAEDPLDARDGYTGLAPVGSFPDGQSPNGLLDMAGNAAEWVADFYDRDQDGWGYGGAAVTNPKGVSFSPYGHAVRGGSYRSAAFTLRTAARRASTHPQADIGFRCAADLSSP